MASVSTLTNILRQLRQAVGPEANLNFIECLLGIAGHEGIVPTELARQLALKESTVHRLCEALESKHQLVMRVPHPTEHRAKQMYLSKRGKELVKRMLEVVED